MGGDCVSADSGVGVKEVWKMMRQNGRKHIAAVHDGLPVAIRTTRKDMTTGCVSNRMATRSLPASNQAFSPVRDCGEGIKTPSEPDFALLYMPAGSASSVDLSVSKFQTFCLRVGVWIFSLSCCNAVFSSPQVTFWRDKEWADTNELHRMRLEVVRPFCGIG